MIIGNSLEALITEKRFEVETIFPMDLIKDPDVGKDWYGIILCQNLGGKIMLDCFRLTVGERSFEFSKGDIIMMQIGLDVSEKVRGFGLLTVSWPSEFEDFERRSFLERSSSKNGFWRNKSFYIIDLSIIEKMAFLKLDARK
jgi:hypothetical protein